MCTQIRDTESERYAMNQDYVIAPDGTIDGQPIRYVAMGDSFSEGVGDEAPTLPNEVHGWTDRLAIALGELNPETRYSNLAIRGYLIEQIMENQLQATLDLQPNLVTLYGGGNNILRPGVDLDAVVAQLAEGFKELRGAGAEVFTITGLDVQGEGPFARTRPRTALFNELVREAADEYGVHIIDYWRMRDFIDWRLWAADKLHMNSYGHTRFARRALEAMAGPEAAERIAEPELPPMEELSAGQQLAENVRWAREFALPWVGRRLRGTSSGDNLEPKYPVWTDPALIADAYARDPFEGVKTTLDEV